MFAFWNTLCYEWNRWIHYLKHINLLDGTIETQLATSSEWNQYKYKLIDPWHNCGTFKFGNTQNIVISWLLWGNAIETFGLNVILEITCSSSSRLIVSICPGILRLSVQAFDWREGLVKVIRGPLADGFEDHVEACNVGVVEEGPVTRWRCRSYQ